MRKLAALPFFLIFCSAAAMLQNPVAARQTNTDSAPPRKPNDSVSDDWRTP